MILNRSVLAVIPARGGSKGIPGKNIRPLQGKPLIAWTIEEAQKSAYIDRLVLTSDDEDIIAVAKSFGCEVPFIRPAVLAKDDTPGIEPVLHAIQEVPGFEYVVLLQPTSPLRSVEDIDGSIELCASRDVNACVSVCKADQNPYWMYTVAEDGTMRSLLPTHQSYVRRQDLPTAYMLNGAVYVAKTSWILKSKSFLSEGIVAWEMPRARSVDIDEEIDFQTASWMLSMHS